MPYINWEPDRSLQDYIKCFWYAERNFGQNDFFAILPDSYIELVFCFSQQPVFFSVGNDHQLLPCAFIVGLLDRPLNISTKGVLKTFGIRFYPWTYYQLIHNATDKNILPIPPAFQLLEQQLNPFMSRKEVYAGLELLRSTCATVLENANGTRDKVLHASKIINAEKGLTNVAALARRVFTSPRQLSRLFKGQLGLGPKPYARKVRFQHIRDRLFDHPESNLTELAYEFGYSDQSHFISDFTSFAGATPRQFAKEMKRFRSILNEYNVRFSQL